MNCKLLKILKEFYNLIKLFCILPLIGQVKKEYQDTLFFSIFIEFNNKETPVYIIDCSDQNKKYIKDWLIRQRENNNHLYYGGWAETLLIKNGEITDYIPNPA